MDRSRAPRPHRRRRLPRSGAGTCGLLVTLVLAACGSGSGSDDGVASTAPSAGSTTSPSPTPRSSTPGGPPTGSPSTGPPSEPPPPPPSCAQRTLDGLDLAGRVGQLLMVGLPVADPAGSYRQLAGVPVGSVFLQGRSSAGVDTVGAAVAAVQDASPLPLLVAVDQEGGQVQSLTGPGFDRIPSALAQGALPPAQLQAASAVWAEQLRKAGVTMDLAPVADTVPAGTAAGNPPIGAVDRQYGSDPGQVAGAVRTLVDALQDAGVAATPKHFPGLGRVTVNTDTDTGATDPATDADDPYLAPFAAAVDAGAAAVMVSSATYPALDPDRLAVFSPAVIALLRDRLGFDGVVVSDDLGQAAAVADVPAGRRAVDAVGAGTDVVLTLRAADAEPMAAELRARATAEPAFAGRVDEAARRVLDLKERFGVLTC